MTLAVGIDIGGTKCALGIVDLETGRPQERLDIPTEGSHSALLQRLGDEARELALTRGVVGVGVGLCELVDRHGDVGSAQSVTWNAAELRSALEHAGPLTIESDVRAAARAEATYTDASEVSSFFFVSLGTGISSTLVIDGSPFFGQNGHAIALGGVHLEGIASGAALQRELSRRTGTSIRTGTQLAIALVQHPDAAEAAARAVARDLAIAINLMDPALVVIAGGLGCNDDFRARVEAAVRPDVYSPATRRVPFRATALGADAGMIGAALASLQRTTR